MSVCAFVNLCCVFVLPGFRAPGCPLAAEERVQGRAGKDACKIFFVTTVHTKAKKRNRY